MNRTSRETQRKIFELYFVQGDNHHTIALKLGIPRSTVTDTLELLPQCLTPLHELAVDLKKQNLTVFESRQGVELKARLADLGIDGFGQLQSYVESSEKMHIDPNYEPKRIVQASMKLSELEASSGKTYRETLRDFDEKNDTIRTLESTCAELREKVETLKTEKKQRLAENKVTEAELAYTAKLRQNLRKYGVELNDAENLQNYLENMHETEANPRKFVQYTKEQGSIEGRTAFLRQEELNHALNLKRLKEEEKLTQTAINNNLSKESELNKQINEKQQKLDDLTEKARALVCPSRVPPHPRVW